MDPEMLSYFKRDAHYKRYPDYIWTGQREYYGTYYIDLKRRQEQMAEEDEREAKRPKTGGGASGGDEPEDFGFGGGDEPEDFGGDEGGGKSAIQEASEYDRKRAAASNQREVEARENRGETGWLASHKKWKNGPSEDHRGMAVLGQGSFGIAGLFQAFDEDDPEKVTDSVVVKQTPAMPGGARWEGQLLQLFQDKCPHIHQIVEGPYEDEGQKTLARLDNGPVERTLTEYMTYTRYYMVGGTLLNYLKHPKNKPSEAQAWSIFKCLAKAVLALHKGSEDLDAPRWEHTQLCHFDIKNENAFVSFVDNEEHGYGKYPIVKLADFSVSAFIPEDEDDWEAFRRQNMQLGNPFVLPPEQGNSHLRRQRRGVDPASDRLQGEHIYRECFREANPEWYPRQLHSAYHYDHNESVSSYEARRKAWEKALWVPKYPVPGTPGNIWQIGWLMYWIITGRGAATEIEDHYPMTRRGKRGVTFGEDMLDDELCDGYSRRLRTLIFDCLAGEPGDRPRPDSLVRDTDWYFEMAVRAERIAEQEAAGAEE